MRKKHTASAIAWLMSLSLIFSFVFGTAAFAQEPDGEYAQEDFTDGGSGDGAPDAAVSDPDAPSVFVITKFPDFEKDENGRYLDPDIEKDFAALTAVCGTPLDLLKLPEDLKVEGYLEAEGPDSPAEPFELEDMVWKLKSDTDEVYSETSPAGTYTFLPDFEKYVEEQLLEKPDFYAQIKLEEGLKPLEITVTVAEEPVTETSAQASTELSEPFDDPLVNPDTAPEPSGDPLVNPDTAPEPSTAPGIFTDPAPEPDMSQDPSGGDVIIIGDGTASDNMGVDDGTDENIFDNLNPDALSGDGTDDTASGIPAAPQQPDTEDPDTADTNTTDTNAADTNAAEPQTQSEEPSGDPSAQDPSSYSPNSTPPIAPAPIAVEDTITVEIQANGTTIPGNTGKDNTYYELKKDTTTTISYQDLPCNFDLSSVNVTFLDATGNEDPMIVSISAEGSELSVSVDGGTPVNFSAGTPVTYQVTKAGATYPVSLSLGTCDHTPGSGPTCTEPQICTVCNSVLQNALGHDWKAATCTEPKTCKRCGAVTGKALGHKMGEWTVEEASTDSKHGTEARYCQREGCDYYETRLLNIIGTPANNYISGLTAGADYSLNTVLTFSASGSAMANKEPINGDIRYVPLSWAVQNTPGAFRDGYTGSFSITLAGSYTLTVTYQQQEYNDGWAPTNIVDTKSVTFTVGSVTTPADANGIRINPQTGDDTPIAAFVAALIVAALVLIIMLIYKKKRK